MLLPDKNGDSLTNNTSLGAFSRRFGSVYQTKQGYIFHLKTVLYHIYMIDMGLINCSLTVLYQLLDFAIVKMSESFLKLV